MAIIQELESYVQSYPAGMETVTDVSLSQNENGRQLRFKIIGVTIPAGSVATISGTKPDGVVYSKAGTIEGSDTVIFDEDVQMTAVFGTWYAKIRIINSGNTIASARVRFIIDKDPVDAGSVPSDSQLDGIIAEMEAYVEDARSVAYGSPLTASTAAAMTDQTKVYVYTGTETGYTAGHWYFWNGTEWHDGGVYNAVAVQTDKTLSVADKAADGKATGEALEHRIPVYSQDEYTTDSTPYLYRTTGGGVAVGTRELDEVVGGSVGWNQLCNGSSVTVQNGHKYYMVKGGTASIGASTGSAITGLTSGTDIVTDLTLLLGSTIADYIYGLETATAGAGVAKLKEWGFFTEDYYPYDAGSLQSVSVSAHEIVGKNLCPFFPANATVSGVTYKTNSDGSVTAKGTSNGQYPFYCVQDSSKLLPYGTYIMSAGQDASANLRLVVSLFRKNNMISYYECLSASQEVQFTIDSTVKSFSIYIRTNGNSTAINGTLYPMIRLASVSDATFEPYTKHTYPLDSSLTLRGIPKLDSNKLYYDGDVYQSDGTVNRRYGIVDLGTLSWEYNPGAGNWKPRIMSTSLSSLAKKPTASSIAANIITAKYITLDDSTVEINASTDKAIAFAPNGTLYVRDSAYTDAASFKSAMSGVYLVYELATPTTEQADPFASVQICAEGGTEEYITTGIVPVGHNTKYPADLAGKLDSIPALPTTAGNYRLKVTVTDGTPSYEWVSA